MSEEFGSVYVFNTSGEAMTAFAPNGLTAGTIGQWETGGGTPYTPAQLAVAMVEDPNRRPGNFVFGDNEVLFKTREVFNFTINIPFMPPGADLILYVSRNAWSLISTEGESIATGEVQNGPAFGQSL